MTPFSHWDPIGIHAFNNPFSYDRESIQLSKYYSWRLRNKRPGGAGSITGEWILEGGDGLFYVSRLYQGKSFSIEKYRDVLKKYQILAATYSEENGRPGGTSSYYFFWFEKAPPNWKNILKVLPQGQGLENIGPPVIQAPDYINEAESMVSSYKRGETPSPKTVKKTTEKKISKPTRLVNPDGLFSVSKRGITQCKVKGKDGNGNFSIHLYIVAHKEATLRPGNLALGGWWYPKYQQFYSQVYMNFPNRSDCNGWNKDLDTWSSIIIPDTFGTVNGQFYSGYRPSNKASSDRKPRTMQCLKVQVEGSGCRPKCVRWENTNRLPDTFYLRDRNDALSLYHYLNIPGAQIHFGHKEKALESQVSDGKNETVLKSSEALIFSQEPTRVNFPEGLTISPLVNDFLLARYYPVQLNQRMLEAMLSSRWSYEQSLEKPLGGRFF